MKKVIFFILNFIVVCFTIPMIFTMKRKTQGTAKNKEQINSNEVIYDYAKYSNIKLLHTDTNEVEELPLDEYLVRSSMCGNACKL